MVCAFCSKLLKSNNKCGACYKHKHMSAKIKKYQYIHRKKTSAERAAYSLLYREQNKERLLAEKRIWGREDRLKHPDKHRDKVRQRVAAVKAATPTWLTAEQKREIRSWHLLKRELQWLSEEELTVDHIIPISGKTVCGLHVPWNLQILPKSMNCSKSTRLVG